MATNFAQALTARGIAPADVATAELRAKSLGGSVETAVLEMGLLTEAQAIELVVELSRLPRASKELLAQLSPASAPLFPQPLAERHRMVPLGLQRRQLQILVCHPVDLSQVDEIGFLLSRPLKLFVGTELEVAEAMREVYGKALSMRLDGLRKKLGPPPAEPAPAQTPTAPRTPTPAVTPVLKESDRAQTRLTEIVPVPPEVAAAAAAMAAARAAPEIAPSRRVTEIELPIPPELAALAAGEPSPPAAVSEAPSPQPSPPSGERGNVEAAAPAPVAPTPRPPQRDTEIDFSVPPATPTPPWSAGTASGATEDLPTPTSPVVQARPITEPDFSIPSQPTPPSPLVAPDAVPAQRVTELDLTTPIENSIPSAPPTPILPPADLTPRSPPAPENGLPLAGESAFEAGPVEIQPLTSGLAGRSGPERRISASAALVSLRTESSRDGVIGTAVGFLRGAFDFVAIFVRHEDTFQVFEASGVDYGGGADLSQTVVDLAHSRVLRTVVDSRAPYVGPVPAGDPLESALGAVGRARLRAVLLYPIVIRDRTVAIVQGDRGGEALAPRQLSDVALVLSQLGAQLERVIRERRKGGSPKTLAPIGIPKPAAHPELPIAVRPPPVPHAVPPPLPVAAPAAAAPIARRTPVPLPPSPDLMFGAAEGDDLALALAAKAEEEPFEVPIDWVDVEEGSSFPEQVRAFLSGDPPARAKAAEILRHGGEDAAWAISERFPGPLFVFRMAIDELPGPEAIGPLMGLMASLGESAVPALVQLAEASSEERRFWATVALAKIGDRRAIEVLSRRLLDSSLDVALAARRGLYRLRNEPEFPEVLDRVTSELTATSNPERLTAIVRALGQFHHVAAVPRLIALVGIRDQQIASAAADALREITRQDFGSTERRWSAWWKDAQTKPRVRWLIEALESRERDLRLAAISELTEIAGLDFGYRSDIEPRKQSATIALWQEWWERDGGRRASQPPLARP